MAKWVQMEQECSNNSDDHNNKLRNAMYGLQWLKWLPRSLELLLRGQKEAETDEQLRQVP
jgi:hypothetical protein